MRKNKKPLSRDSALERGSLALEHLLFIGAAIFILGAGLKVFFTNIDNYYSCFSESKVAVEQCKQRRNP